MDQEIKDLIEKYVKQIESKEVDLVFLKKEIDKIIYNAHIEMKGILSDLDVKFNAYSITEEEYIYLVRKERENIVQNTKEKLDVLVQGIEVVSAQRKKISGIDKNKLKDLRQKLNLID